MNQQDELQARLNAVRTIIELFPHGDKPSTKAAVAKYIELTADIPLDEFIRCLDEAAATSKFFPTVADIRDVYKRTRADNPTLALPTAEEAWGSVQRAIAGVGYLGAPKFQHPIVQKVVDNFGWRDLCMSENVGVTRSNFMRMYAEMVRREEELQGYLPKTQHQLETNGVAGLIAQTAKQLTMNGAKHE